ncbi:TPA: hypothetical protein ACOZ3K_002427 [Yersinia enterocolitica]|uniref:hypothetical protein n=2 Tax=Yersinia TaxID=629 RepID=UPI0030C10495|nr:hypothetical protein [Yersinia enterocolitica]
MGFIINDVVWWKISLNGFMNGWLPGILTFLLGLWFSKITDQRKLRQKLKNDILEIFIPVFNSGESISISMAEDACQKMRMTFNAYKRIYPNMFNSESEKKLGELLNEGFVVNNVINEKFKEPDYIQKLIQNL